MLQNVLVRCLGVGASTLKFIAVYIMLWKYVGIYVGMLHMDSSVMVYLLSHSLLMSNDVAC
jgi:hypothetical protein